jgi:hypothetical protein
MDRRKFIALSASALACLAVKVVLSRLIQPAESDEAFLDDLERRSFDFFRENSDGSTGLVPDRGITGEGAYSLDMRPAASAAATGFGLAALGIGVDRGWIDRTEAGRRVRTALRFLAERAPHEHGWYYHWMDGHTGERSGAILGSPELSEVSSIDTAFLLAGVLSARGYFAADREIVGLANQIYQRVDFPWMRDPATLLLRHGWTPESGFLPYRWDEYSEASLLYLLAIASPAHPIAAEAWYAWKRTPNRYAGYRYVGTAPLFTYQYSHAFMDFRGRRDGRASHVNWFVNSIIATHAHRRFCLDLAGRFPGYSDEVWGITPSRSSAGYTDWGGPPVDPRIDGTVVPAAAAGSLMFAPEICLPALRAMRARYGQSIYGRYGFTDAFNPGTGWVSPDATGLGLGIALLSAENLRTGRPWQCFMAGPEIQPAMDRIDLRRTG